METLLDFPWSYLFDLSWPYWLVGSVAVLTGILTARNLGESTTLVDCPHCGEPLATNGDLCELCRYEDAAERQGFLL